MSRTSRKRTIGGCSPMRSKIVFVRRSIPRCRTSSPLMGEPSGSGWRVGVKRSPGPDRVGGAKGPPARARLSMISRDFEPLRKRLYGLSLRCGTRQRTMPDLYNYAREKLTAAVRVLAVGESDARSRVWSAYLEFHPLWQEHLPPQLQDEFSWIMHELTKRPEQRTVYIPGTREWVPEGLVPANIRRMKNRTAARIATAIVDLEYSLRT